MQQSFRNMKYLNNMTFIYNLISLLNNSRKNITILYVCPKTLNKYLLWALKAA